MSVSSLPEWKQLLLERKRREEEEREKREKEEEDKLASMPAWKRGIIQRRRMKQESFGDKEREDITGPWLDEETIIPVGQNSFIRTHGGWRRGREAERAGEMGHEKGNEQEIEVGRERQKEKERGHVKGHDGESGKGRDIEIQIERYRDRSGGRERDRSAGRETSRDTVRDRERDCPRGRKEEEREEGDSNSPTPKYSYPLVPGLRTIRADNIIIIEQDRKGSDERRERGRDAKCNKDGGKDCERQLEREVAWLMMKDKERENLREKDRPRTQVASSEKEDRRYGDTDDSIHNERGVRVSELLSKFGEHTKKFREYPKPPSRSKSSECFIRPGRGREPFCLDDGDRRGEEEHAGFRGVPKRSFSFSDRGICTKENGMQDEGNHDRKGVPTTPSASPSQSTSVSPSPSPSPTHFTIRSLSGGQQVKRGTTITITPRKPVGGAAVEAVSVSSRPLANTSAQSQMPVLTEEGERGKKRYPTAEEIEVIGGYQNLDKSCLVKTSKASPKGVSVDCRLAYCRLCTINCIDEVSHLVEITPTTRATLPPPPYLILSV
uniref:Phostensin/Taperin N-terminal domain-containing protein n=1 Tax=Oncorhynchus mykiss TaxID=8022 RepID=A0A8C7RQC5_ONCMY